MEADPHRDETEAERYDRNWNDLLQELRVTQTGVQILAGFLLTLPFSNRFASLGGGLRALYLTAFASACLSIVLLVAPVSAHRMVFRRHEKGPLVALASRCLTLGLVALALTISLVAGLIFAVVQGRVAGTVAGLVALLLFCATWVALPRRILRQSRHDGPR